MTIDNSDFLMYEEEDHKGKKLYFNYKLSIDMNFGKTDCKDGSC